MTLRPRPARRPLPSVLLSLAAALPVAWGGDGVAAEPPLPPPPATLETRVAPANELRAAWVATVANIDWPSRPGLSVRKQKAELDAIVRAAAAVGLNALFFQVRPHADAMYPSELEPWSPYLTGTMGKAPRPAWDPLQHLIDAATPHGIAIHAWLNPYRAGHPKYTGAYPDTHVSATLPDAVHTLGDSGMVWMDPADPRGQAHTLAVVTDLLDRYAIAGIHLDDYFYPYPSYLEKLPGGEFPDDRTWAAYRDAGGTRDRDGWRREQVDTLVEAIHQRVKASGADRVFGISPFGIYRPGHPPHIAGFDQVAKLHADPRRWMEAGWVDYIVPQLYWSIEEPDQSFVSLLRDWHAHNPRGVEIYAGLYTSKLLETPPKFRDTEIPLQVRWTRALTPAGRQAGHVHFSMKALMQNPRGLSETLAELYRPAAIDGP